MRSRILKPGFFQNAKLAELPPRVRLLYAGLWLLADREGRLKNAPGVIAEQLFPFDGDGKSCRQWVRTALKLCREAGFTAEYVGVYPDGKKVNVLFIPAFLKHQKPHPREAASRLPGPPSELLNVDIWDEKLTPKGPPAGPAELSQKANLQPVLFLNSYLPDPSDLDRAPAASRPAIFPNAKKHKNPDGNPAENLPVIVKIAHMYLDYGTATSDLPEAVKCFCAVSHIAYDSEIVGKAVDVALIQRDKVGV